MKIYVLTVSRFFPSTHLRKGEPTEFFPNIDAGVKKHTIRENYELWKKRIDEVNAGIAVISLRYWSGKPYCSPQIEHKQFGKGEIGIQKLTVGFVRGHSIDDVYKDTPSTVIASNDGLSFLNFQDWFRKVKDQDEMAIIHFTNFRY